MARLIPAAERILRAHALVQKAHQVPTLTDSALSDLSFAAQVKDLLRQARDLIKFIPYTPSASSDMKTEVAALFKEIDQAEKEILHKHSQ
jgi:hypothetical protein